MNLELVRFLSSYVKSGTAGGFDLHHSVMSQLRLNAIYNMTTLERKLHSYIIGYMVDNDNGVYEVSINGYLLMLKHGIIKNKNINIDDIIVEDHICTLNSKDVDSYIDILSTNSNIDNDYEEKYEYKYIDKKVFTDILNTVIKEFNISEDLSDSIEILIASIIDIQYNDNEDEHEHYAHCVKEDMFPQERIKLLNILRDEVHNNNLMGMLEDVD